MFVKRNRSNLIFLFFVWALFFAGIFVYSAKNVYADVIIVDSNITVDTTWVTGNVYVIENDVSILTGISLFIEPGVIIKLKDDASLLVDGNLQAIGTANEQIFFTSWYDDSVGGDTNGDGGATIPDPNNKDRVWGRIRFSNSSNDDSLIEYAVIRYAGSINDWDCCPAGDVRIAAVEIIGASPSIHSVAIYMNRLHGISLSSLSSGDSPSLICLDIEDNQDHGLLNEMTSVNINATNLWWGDVTGPYHPVVNSDGIGNRVSDGVSFVPFRDEPCTYVDSNTTYAVFLPLVVKP